MTCCEMLALLQFVFSAAIGAFGFTGLGHIQVHLGVGVPEFHLGVGAGAEHATGVVEVCGLEFDGLAHFN